VAIYLSSASPSGAFGIVGHDNWNWDRICHKALLSMINWDIQLQTRQSA
jgi:hypothetical protein